MAKFVYTDTKTVDATAGTVIDTVFSANGMYDPDVTGIGHQPYGFDQMMAMFEHYTVIASKIEVSIIGNQTNLPFWCAILLRPGATSETGNPTQPYLEQPDVRAKLLAGNIGVSPVKVTRGFSAKKYFSKRSIVGDSLYRGDETQNPPDQAYYHILIAPQTTTDNLTSQVFNVKITYVAVLTEPNILVSS